MTVNENQSVFVAVSNISTMEVIRDMLQDEVKALIFPEPGADMVKMFDRCQAQLIVLAFNHVEQSIEFYERLKNESERLHLKPCRILLLCDKFEAEKAYSLCRKGTFDNYVVFWPLSFDPHRLKISIYQELRSLDSLYKARDRLRNTARLHAVIDELEGVVARLVDGGSVFTEQVRDVLEEAEELRVGALPHMDRDAGVSTEDIGSLYDCINVLKNKVWHFESLCREVEHSYQGALKQVASAKPSVLVVEDDAFYRNIMMTLLKAGDYQVNFAKTAAEALGILQENTPDLILMDLMMPGMNGLEAIRHIRHNEWTKHIPVIVISGQSQKEVISRCIQLGAFEFILKPFNRQIFISKIEKALGSREAKGPANKDHWNMM